MGRRAREDVESARVLCNTGSTSDQRQRVWAQKLVFPCLGTILQDGLPAMTATYASLLGLLAHVRPR